MKTNARAKSSLVRTRTHEGAPAVIPKPVEQLLRQVSTCMLFEDTFYEKGSQIADGIAASCSKVTLDHIAAVAILAREDLKLRHAPLFLLAQMNKRRGEQNGLLADTVYKVVQRADELSELLAIVSKVEGQKSIKKILSHGLAKGLAMAFTKFNEYSLAKYNMENEIKLRDVLFLTHPKPKDKDQAKLWKKLVDGKLEIPDTWETQLSAGKDKKKTFERLIEEGKLGYLALLRNLRNIDQAGVDFSLVEKAILSGAKGSKALPFRFIAASRHAPMYAQALSDAMIESLSDQEKLQGVTAVLVDVSGSMSDRISQKSEINRWEAAAGVAVLAREVCEQARVFTFADDAQEVPNRKGIALVEAIRNQVGGGTSLGNSLRTVFTKVPKLDRVIVFTDEQSSDTIPNVENGYIINVASYAPSLQTGNGWTRINGFSERIIDWIRFEESQK